MILSFPFLPPSVNQIYYTDFTHKTRHKSKAYRSFIDEVGYYILQQKIKPVTGSIEISYNFFFPDKRRRDVANYEKALSDCLVHYGIIEDDSLIQKMTLEKVYSKGKPETVIKILALESEI